METPEQRALAKAIAEELVFALQTGSSLKVRDTTRPEVQTIQGEVMARVKGIPELLDGVSGITQAIQENKQEPVEIQKVEVTNPQAIPDYPTEITASLKELPDLKKHLKSIEEAIAAIDLPSPQIEVKPSDVHIQAPDLSQIGNGLHELARQLKAASKTLENIEEKELPTTNLKPLEKVMKEVLHSIDTLTFPSPERNPKNAQGYLQTVFMAKDKDSGVYYEVPGLFSSDGVFQLSTSGSGTATIPVTPSTNAPWAVFPAGILFDT